MLKIIIISFIFLANGCFVHKGYEGEERPLEELSILKISGPIDIRQIDNKDIFIRQWGYFEQEIKLLPGKHEITISIGSGIEPLGMGRFKLYPSLTTNSLRYDFIAGRKYEIYKLEKEKYGYYYGIREIGK
jgi:hypothetical protein